MPKGIRNPIEEYRLGSEGGGMGGMGAGKSWPQSITKTPAEARAIERERELVIERKRQQAIAENEASYAARKARGEIKSSFDRTTGTRSAKDYKEKEKTPEFSGEMSMGSPRGRDYGSGDRTPRTSDDYKKGGKVSGASKRADGIAQRGKTRGKMC